MNIFDKLNQKPMKTSNKTLTFALAFNCYCLLLSLNCKAQVCFNYVGTFSVGIRPAGITNDDFNGDGIKDLATANNNSNNISILLGIGNGNFGAATNFTTGNSPVSIIVSDFNGDGKVDLATYNDASADVSILLGNGNGSFGLASSFGTGASSSPICVISDDFNGDGKPDIATADVASNNQISVLLGTGTGSFGSATHYTVYPIGHNPYQIISGDFNEDGFKDITTGAVSILGNGSGNFGPPTSMFGGYGSETSADFNEDGKPDLAGAGLSVAGISLGNGNGTFSNTDSIPIPSAGYVTTSADFDGDGHIDLAVIESNSASILLGTGTGSLTLATTFSIDPYRTFVTCGDFNGDGKIDIAITNSNSNINNGYVSVYLNCTVTGIANFNKKEQATVYPNPNTGQFTIKADNAEKLTVQVRDVNGKLILNKNIIGNANIDAGSLAEGIYTINIISSTGTITKKLIVQPK